MTRADGKKRMARSSSIRWSVSRLDPLTGTFAKHNSEDPLGGSAGCNLTKSLACAMLWCGNAVNSVSTFARAAACLDLNLSKLNVLGLAIDIASSSVGGPLLGACSAGGNACTFFSIVIGGLVVVSLDAVVEVEHVFFNRVLLVAGPNMCP